MKMQKYKISDISTSLFYGSMPKEGDLLEEGDIWNLMEKEDNRHQTEHASGKESENHTANWPPRET